MRQRKSTPRESNETISSIGQSVRVLVITVSGVSQSINLCSVPVKSVSHIQLLVSPSV